MPDAEDAPATLASSASTLEPPTLTLGPEFTIAQAAAQRQRLLDAVQSMGAGPLRLDLSGVSDFDSAGVQLLLSTQRSVQEMNAEVLIVQASDVVLEVLRCYGLEPTLGAAGPTPLAQVAATR